MDDEHAPQSFVGCVCYFGLLALFSWAVLGVLGYGVYWLIVNW